MHNADVNLADLLLDVENPRHERKTSQREAIAGLLSDDGDKLFRLAADIGKNGLSPIDLFLVMEAEEGRAAHIVLEGNRRTACLKLLTNPELAGDHRLKRRFVELSVKSAPPLVVDCAVVGSRDEAKHWLELRHSGEAQGAGTVPWGAEQRARFSSRRSSHRDWGLALAEALVAAYPSNADLQADVAEVRAKRLTTLGRLVSDSYVRSRLTCSRQGTQLTWQYSSKALEPILSKIVRDLADGTTVSDLKQAPQKRRYFDGLEHQLLPKADDLLEQSERLATIGGKPVAGRKHKVTPPSAPTPPPSPTTPALAPLLGGLVLSNMGGKIAVLLAEVQDLSLEKYPNAAAALLRTVIELTVSQAHKVKKGREPQSLADGIKWSLTQVDPTGKDDAYRGVQAGLIDGTSLLASKTMHAYLHNVHFHATATDLRSIASNYTPLLRALDALV